MRIRAHCRRHTNNSEFYIARFFVKELQTPCVSYRIHESSDTTNCAVTVTVTVLYAGPCDPRWRATLDTRVVNGANVSASSVEACKAACARNTSCTGVDWNPTAAAGKRCWLSGPWSANLQSAPGITRFDLYRNQSCPGNAPHT